VRLFLPAAFLFITLPGCSSSSESLSCPRTVDAYCATTNAPECAYRDYASALPAECSEASGDLAHHDAGTPLPRTYYLGGCSGLDALGVREGTGPMITRWFASDGTLEAIVSSDTGGDTCVAGPPSFQVPVCTGENGTPCGPQAFSDGGQRD
jgi:hypothetical protein